MSFEPKNEGEEAGLTVYMNERHHYDLAVKLLHGRKVVVFRRTIGLLKTEQVYDCTKGPIVLTIQAQPELFTFYVQQGQSDPLEVGVEDSRLLSTEVAGGFTGTFIAMYATCDTGHGTPAQFDWFDYEPLS
jgi:xylan 1,4-beta-xylosidase